MYILAPHLRCDATTATVQIELYHLALLDVFEVRPPPGKRETSGPNPCLSSNSVPPVHLRQDSKQKAWQMKCMGREAAHNATHLNRLK